MTGAREAARLWAGESAFAAGGSPHGLPFALVPSGPTAGGDVGRAPSALSARPLLGGKGAPALRVPIMLDTTQAPLPDAKVWAALCRGASAAGAALLVSPHQLKERETVLKAAGVPLILCAAPGEALTPELAAHCGALAARLSGPQGAPALPSEEGLSGLVEALRALSGYKSPVLLLAPPGRVPSAVALRAAAGAGAIGVGLIEGEGPQAQPFAALAGDAHRVRARGPLPAFLATDAVTDGVALALAMAAGAGLLATALPVRLAAEAERATDADWKATGERLGALLRTLWQDAQRAASAAGVKDPRDLGPDNLRALTYDAAALSGARLAGFGERLPWWTH
mgnify:CR=1 FL=1